MTDIYLVTGFLGAGKTTFLKEQLENTDSKVGVLINEFGRIGIDGALVAREELEMVELTNGSIFCSCLKDNFISGVIDLLQKDLDIIYIESSGLSDPANMLSIIELISKTVTKDFKYHGSICIIDAVYFFEELEMMVSVRNQVLHSNLIILNKTDLVSEEVISDIEKRIYDIRGEIDIIKTSYGRVRVNKELMSKGTIGPGETSNTTDNKPRTFNVRLKDLKISIEEIQTLVDTIAPYCHRIKGFVRIDNTTYKIDTVQDNIEIIKDDKEYSFGNVVFISKIGIKLLNLFKSELPESIMKKINISL